MAERLGSSRSVGIFKKIWGTLVIYDLSLVWILGKEGVQIEGFG